MSSKRYHQGTSIGAVVQELIDTYRIAGKLNEVRLHEIWPQIVGTVAAKHTSKLMLRGTTLVVEFSTPLLKHELHYRKEDLLVLLNERLGAGRVLEIRII